jgi:hypothetical protein
MLMQTEQKLAKDLTTDDILTNEDRSATFPVTKAAEQIKDPKGLILYRVVVRMPSGSPRTLHYDQYAREEIVVS